MAIRLTLSQRIERAVDAPIVRQLFTSSPNDPRYHMLTWISNKFSQRLTEPPHEPRAAMFINRFTRTATIMYATSGVSEILGVEPGQLISQSFYFCIQEECLGDAIRCLESAKANDSIAYLRFWFRNPLQTAHNGLGSANESSPIELEAVVSCTSDGLVVILRRARAPLPTASVPRPTELPLTSGVFAAPWASEPVLSYGAPSHPSPAPISVAGHSENRTTVCRDSVASGSAARAAHPEVQSTFCREGMKSSTPSASGFEKDSHVAEGPGKTGPHSSCLMDTIREVAVFAWGIVGINRDLEQYTCGTPTGNAHPGEKMDVDEVKQEESEETN